jgi:2-polyprenyl-3-methyl-5-hydroxy-6-metoxy-1,4-benzoquinol methylase
MRAKQSRRKGVSTAERQAHWQNVYRSKGEREVSWFEETPALSLDLIRATGVGADAAIIDIGGGASRLVDALLAAGFKSVSVLDLSQQALAAAQARLGARGAAVNWIVADVTTWRPSQTYEVWHDRAALHFLTQAEDRAAYAACLRRAVRPGGHVIIGTFAPDGPERCSGLPVMRHDADTLAAMLGPAFTLVESRRHEHRTPTGAIQRFQFSRFERRALTSAPPAR